MAGAAAGGTEAEPCVQPPVLTTIAKSDLLCPILQSRVGKNPKRSPRDVGRGTCAWLSYPSPLHCL